MSHRYKQTCAYDDNWPPIVQYGWDPGILHFSWFGFTVTI